MFDPHTHWYSEAVIDGFHHNEMLPHSVEVCSTLRQWLDSA